MTNLAAVGRNLKTARLAYEHMKDHAKQAARDAYAQGIPQTVIASELGIDRARTLRRWLGKVK